MRIRRIDPYRLYSTEELQEVLHGSIKIQTLKQYGLVGLASGYWGSNIIFAINRYWRKLLSERGMGAAETEAFHAIFEKREGLPGGRLPDHPKTDGVLAQRLCERISRTKVHPRTDEAGEVETYRKEFDRLTQQDKV